MRGTSKCIISQANKYAQAQTVKMMLYPAVMLPAFLLTASTHPINEGKIIPPIEPAMPPMPTTELTAAFGNISDVVVKIFALQAWCAAAARLIKATACHILVA